MRKEQKRIPVKIDWFVDETGKGGIEITMNLDDFESSGTSIRKNIGKFKENYLATIEKARKFEKLQKSKGKTVSTKQRWKACNILAKFNQDFENEFKIINFNDAYSRDFNLPKRSIRTYLDFGSDFTQEEISDKIPYSTYAELTFVANQLKKRKIFEKEKKQLLQWSKENKIPNRNEYRKYLRKITNA